MHSLDEVHATSNLAVGALIRVWTHEGSDKRHPPLNQVNVKGSRTSD